MTIEEVKIADIKPYERNQKKHPESQVKNIAKSIEKYGFVQPIVIDKDNNIIIGHGRYLAAEKLNMESVPAVYAENLTDEQIRELRILDNKLNESEWDIDKLKLDLEELDFSEFDLSFDIPDNIQFDAAETPDVAVQIIGSHSCMTARGIKNTEARTTTRKFLGVYKESYDLQKMIE